MTSVCRARFTWIGSPEMLRRIAADILGEMAVPLSPNEITRDNSSALNIHDFSKSPGGVIDFSIGKGIAYIHGYPVILKADMNFRTQPDYPEPELSGQGDDLLVYIEVWERTISYIDDETIRVASSPSVVACTPSKRWRWHWRQQIGPLHEFAGWPDS